MKRVLSRIGIGGATVETVLPDAEVSPGETVHATVELTGGESSQDIAGLSFTLKARERGGGMGEQVLGTYLLDVDVTLEPGEERASTVDIEIPPWTPITQGDVSVWLETGVDISWAVDASDEDQLEVVPDEQVAALFEGVDSLGFALAGSRLVETDYLEDRPFAQQFEFRPTDEYADDLDDIEVTVIPRESDLRIFLELGQVDEVEAEYDVSFDENEVALTFEHANAEMMASRIRRELDRHTTDTSLG